MNNESLLLKDIPAPCTLLKLVQAYRVHVESVSLHFVVILGTTYYYTAAHTNQGPTLPGCLSSDDAFVTTLPDSEYR